MSGRISDFSVVEYHSVYGVHTYGLVVAYSEELNAYVIDISPSFVDNQYILPGGKLVIVEVDRVKLALSVLPQQVRAKNSGA